MFWITQFSSNHVCEHSGLEKGNERLTMKEVLIGEPQSHDR